MCVQYGAVCILSAVDPAFFPVTGSGQISVHLQNNSPEEKLSSQHVALFSVCFSSPSLFFSLSLSLSLTPLSLTQTEIPLSYCTLPLPFSFFGFHSLTLSVSFHIMLSVKIPCGRAVSNKHNRTHRTVHACTDTDVHACAQTHGHVYA